MGFLFVFQDFLEEGEENKINCILECGLDKVCYIDICCGKKRTDFKKIKNGDSFLREGSIKGLERFKLDFKIIALEEV